MTGDDHRVTDTSDLDLPTLLHLHKRLGALICEDMGHDWQNVQFSTAGAVTMGSFEKCLRCGETRSDMSVTTSSAGEISWSGGEP